MERCVRAHRGIVMRVACLALLTMGCGSRGTDSSATWPQWQLIEASEPPSGWQMEEASPAFDAWQAVVVVSRLSFSENATTIRFAGGRDTLDVRLAALPFERFLPTMVEGDTVRIDLIRRQGFEGVAQGLGVYDQGGRLLLVYDDGGYGPAFYEAGARGGLSVERELRGTGRIGAWTSRDVTFEVDGDSFVLGEGRSALLGRTGLVVTVVVSQEWTGPPMTDVDLSPLAWLVYRTGKS